MASFQINTTQGLWDDCETICIDHRDNICTTCCKAYTHHKRYLWLDESDKTIKSTELITAHPSCRSLLRKIEEQKEKIKEQEQKLLDLEFKLFIFKSS